MTSVARMEQAEEDRHTATDRVHVAWFGFWIVANVVLLRHRRFDPYPFDPYQFLTLTVSLEAIFLSTFILISQNRSGRVADRRNRLDLQINMPSEQENTKMLSMLRAIQNHLGVEDGDP